MTGKFRFLYPHHSYRNAVKQYSIDVEGRFGFQNPLVLPRLLRATCLVATIKIIPFCFEALRSTAYGALKVAPLVAPPRQLHVSITYQAAFHQAAQ